MLTSWITLNPQWYAQERNLIARRYPEFQVVESLLRNGILCYFGELAIRPSTGTRKFPVQLYYPSGTPFECPVVTPVEKMPVFDGDGKIVPESRPRVQYFDKRHQMPSGGLCLFQRETRGTEGGEGISGVTALARAEQWLLGYLTGRWPPDSEDAEIEGHFRYGGDVLLGSEFYEAHINGNGRFFMARDMKRHIMGRDQSTPPFIGTTITVGRVEIVHDARADVIQAFPWLANGEWDPTSLQDGLQNQDEKNPFKLFHVQAYWWEVNEEPQPFHDGAGLLRELETAGLGGDVWAAVSRALGGELTTESEHYFGILYPGRAGTREWLVVRVEMPSIPKVPGNAHLIEGNEEEKRKRFERASISCLHVHGLRPKELQLRNTSVTSEQLAEKKVALIGLGALGGRVAELLAQAGVGAFRLNDNDVMRTGNVVRHIGGVSDFGSRKNLIIANRLKDVNPNVDVELWSDSASSSLTDLAEFIEDADVLVCTTADENLESAINQIALLKRCVVVYGRAMRSGSVGRVFLVRPEKDACKACLGAYALERGEYSEDAPKWLHVSERPEDVLLHECGRPVIPASAIDLSFISSLIARKVLDVLEGKSDVENHLVWSRDSATDIDVTFDRPFVAIESSFPPREDCPVCQEPEVKKVVLNAAAEETIKKEVEASTSVETGGILIGYIEDRRAIVLRATGPGPNAVRTKVRFEKDIQHTQRELDLAAKELGQHGQYIGEWHSHLEPSPSPSGQDVFSMCGISMAPNYTTNCPAMIIAGVDVENAEMTILKAWTFPLSGRMFEVEIEGVQGGDTKS